MGTSTRVFRGLPVVDATKPINVEIGARDLRGGYTRLPNYCVVEHALEREMHKKKDEVFVHSTKVYILSDDRTFWHRYTAPLALRFQIVAHDQGGLFKEGIYKLLAPSKSERVDAHRQYKKSYKKPTGRPPRMRHQTSERERPSFQGKE